MSASTTRPSRQEVRRLFEQYQQTRDPAVRQQLVDLFNNLVLFLARKFQNRGEPLEDILQVGYLSRSDYEYSHHVKIGRDFGLTPRARIVATAVSGADPTIMLTGPAPACRKALAKANLTVDDIDLVEMNEAFAAVVLRFMRDMDLPWEKVNVNGGAIALGHPLGATGAMILGTVVDELERRELRRGMVTLCIGGGMGLATIVERV